MANKLYVLSLVIPLGLGLKLWLGLEIRLEIGLAIGLELGLGLMIHEWLIIPLGVPFVDEIKI